MDRLAQHSDSLQIPRSHDEPHHDYGASCDAMGTLALTQAQSDAASRDKNRNVIVGSIRGQEEANSQIIAGSCESDLALDSHWTTPQEAAQKALDAAVRTTDSEESANTARAWILGLLFVTIVAGVNMFLSMRWPAVNIPTVVVVLLVQPIGSLWARCVPNRRVEMLGLVWSLNPGPFSLKEHAVVTLMANVIAGFAYPAEALLALCAKPMYGLDLGWGFQILFTLSSHLIGIGLAGLLRKFLIWPRMLIWPANFSTTTLLYALHDHSRTDPSQANGWKISRYYYFCIVAFASFLWYWIPGILWKGLSVFAFVTWIRPQNVTLNQLFGGFTGLSLIPLTFDWTIVISWLQDPILAPTSTHLNVLVGLLGFMIVPAIIISFKGALYSEYLPINSNIIFDNTQHEYNVTRILQADFTLDLAKYRSYSPLFLSPTFLLSYGSAFASVIASIVHIIIFHGREVGPRFWTASEVEPDIHMRLIARAANWWYTLVLAISVSLGLVTILAYPSQLPWWAFFASLGIVLVLTVPCCMIYSTTNIRVNLSAVNSFLAGFIVPGRPIAVIIFEIFSNLTIGKVQVYSQDLKLAHYLKIPPRVTFSCQAAATVWATLVQVATMNWALGAIDQVCTPGQKDSFTCPTARSIFSSSVVFGVIGPKKVWGPKATYRYFNFAWLFGLSLPVLFYVLLRFALVKRRYQWLNAPVMLASITSIPPASPLSYFTWVFFGLIFNCTIRRRFGGWWRTYNYLTAAGMDSGLLVSTMVVLLGFTLRGVPVPTWWGNSWVLGTADANGTAIRKTLHPGETFGPERWR